MTSRLSVGTTLKRIATILFVGICLLTSSAQAQVTPDVEISIGDGQGDPGSSGNTVTISMDNPVEPVRALTINIDPVPGGHLTLSNLLEAGRTPNFTIKVVNSQPDGSYLLLFLDPSRNY